MRLTSRSAFLALVAAFAISAVTASAASAAAPEFKPSTKQAFSGTVGVLTMETSVGTQFTCKKGSSSGEVTGASTVAAVVLTLSECSTKEEEGAPCYLKSAGAKNKGEIVTTALVGELGEVASLEATTGVGLLLKPASGERWAVIEASCLPPSALEGDIAAEVTPIKTSAKTLKLVFLGTSGSQKITTITVKGIAKRPELAFMSGLEKLSWETTDELEFKSNVLEVT
jgi:hypothetical protein